ncbi:MAG: KOW motif-containing protein [Bdellovibrionales bacterium]
MKKLKIKKSNTVEVISGADKGKTGAVLDIKVSKVKDREKIKVLVEGVAMKTHYDKQEGLKRKESYIDYSNVKVSQVVAKKATTKKKKAKKKATKKA